MVTADRETVAVSGYDNNIEVWTGQRQSGCISQRAAVRDMEGIGIDIGG